VLVLLPGVVAGGMNVDGGGGGGGGVQMSGRSPLDWQTWIVVPVGATVGE
jgi:hypothetical protein